MYTMEEKILKRLEVSYERDIDLYFCGSSSLFLEIVTQFWHQIPHASEIQLNNFMHKEALKILLRGFD